MTKGSPTAGGAVVRLEAVRVGGRWLTSRAAVARFVAALTAAASPAALPVPARPTAAARSRAAEKAADALKKMGA